MHRYHRLVASFTLGAGVLLSARAADAQTVHGYAIDRFEPSERGSAWFTGESLDYSGRLQPATGVVGDLGLSPQTLHDTSGVEHAVVGSQLAFHFGAALAFAERFRVGLSAPVFAYESGTTVTRTDGTYVGASGGAMGDLRAGLDARLYGAPKGLFRLGLGVRVWLPTGDPARYTGDGSARLSSRVDLAGDAGLFTWSATGGVLLRGLRETFGATAIGDELPFGATAGVKLLGDKLRVGVELQGSVAVSQTPIHWKNDIPLEGLVMGRYTLGDFRIGAGVGPGLSAASGTANRALLALEYAPSPSAPPPDCDGDGVADARDACPAVKGVASDDPRRNGCPLDRDGDGIPDAQDACPEVAGVATSDPKTNGCPPDRDGNGVPDALDACADVAGAKTADPRTNGCPADKDHDGIPDALDACADVAGVKTADPRTNGCPADQDHDGIPDTLDACPADAGQPSADPSKNGCPEVRVAAGQIRILEQIKFAEGRAEILPESDHLLGAVARTLAAHPEIDHVRVEGHTDDRGSRVANRLLSQARAASVVAALVRRGVAPARLTPKGVGPEGPIDTNETEAGRVNNRRVEFHIVGRTPAAKP